jgi:hypothetical protein
MSPKSTTRRTVTAAIAAAAVGAAFASTAAPASAARGISQSTSFTCSTARVGVSPPRVWSKPGRPVQAVWIIQLERWSGSRWYRYTQSRHISTFDYYGQSLTSWSSYNTIDGGRYVNSRLWVPVRHRGFYRVASAVGAGNLQSIGYVNGPGSHCYVP